jgi:hypothetical protein
MKVTGHIRDKSTKSKKTYQIIIEFQNTTGKRNRKYYTVHCTKREAQKKLEELIYEFEHGIHVEPSKATVSDFLDEYMKTYITPIKSPTTAESYQKIINRYINPNFGHLELESVTPLMVQKWVNNLSSGEFLNANKGLKPQTVKNIFLVLHSSMGKAVELKLIKESPCEYTKLPKLVKYQAQVFDDSELQKFITA